MNLSTQFIRFNIKQLKIISGAKHFSIMLPSRVQKVKLTGQIKEHVGNVR